jgi:hypothetical protein
MARAIHQQKQADTIRQRQARHTGRIDAKDRRRDEYGGKKNPAHGLRESHQYFPFMDFFISSLACDRAAFGCLTDLEGGIRAPPSLMRGALGPFGPFGAENFFMA